ncbi:MAG TPA: hypothetical protein VIJ85_03315 [Rhizomicrobium sp.]
MFVLMDVWNTILHIVHSADLFTLGLMALAAIGAGFMTMELSGVLTTSLAALIGFAVLMFLRAVLLQHADASALLTADWHAFATMQALMLLAYVIIFAVVIGVVSTIRNAVFG